MDHYNEITKILSHLRNNRPLRLVIYNECPGKDPIIIDHQSLEYLRLPPEDTVVTEFIHIDDPNLPQLLVMYAYRYGSRILQVEHIILRDLTEACQYAEQMVGRWPELEKLLLASQDAVNSYRYAYCVMRGRWLEAEGYIINDPRVSIYYAINVIKGRWLEAEKKMILYYGSIPCIYAQRFLKA